MNHLVIGLTDKTDRLLQTEPPYLWIGDEPPGVPRATYFDPYKHCFNLLPADHKKARDLSALVYSIFPEGANTLTVRNGRRALAALFKRAKRLDKLNAKTDPELEAEAAVGDILFSPVLERIFCGGDLFDFDPDTTIIARINRAELGDFDAFVLGTFLMSQYQGQIVLEDAGFYLRPLHTTLIRQDRLALALNYLAELDGRRLEQAVLAIKDKHVGRVTLEDAERLVPYLKVAYNPGELTGLREGEFKQ